MNKKSLTVIGGDSRMIYAGKELEKKGFDVFYHGFDDDKGVSCVDINKACLGDYIVLPLPSTYDIKNINAPFSKNKIPADSKLASLLEGRPVFCAMKERLIQADEAWEKVNLIDYYKNEDFILKNADATAFATELIIQKELKLSLKDTQILVLGFGRVGKACAKALSKCGARITVGARRESDFREIDKLGFFSENSTDIKLFKNYKIIINTIPALILCEDVIKRLNKDTVVIDLASKSGGVDFESCRKYGISSLHATGLPGKYCPERAGKIIEEIISDFIKEDAM